jgi:hypothetical protein
MSKLLVSELVTELKQNFTVIPEKRFNLVSLYPHLYLHNEPSGSFTFTLKKSSQTIFSKTVTASQIKSSIPNAQDFSHLWYPLIPDNDIYIESGDYSLELTHSGYTFNESAYL